MPFHFTAFPLLLLQTRASSRRRDSPGEKDLCMQSEYRGAITELWDEQYLIPSVTRGRELRSLQQTFKCWLLLAVCPYTKHSSAPDVLPLQHVLCYEVCGKALRFQLKPELGASTKLIYHPGSQPPLSQVQTSVSTVESGSTCSLQERLIPACARHYTYMGSMGSDLKVAEQHSTGSGNVTGKVFAKVLVEKSGSPWVLGIQETLTSLCCQFPLHF